NSGMLRCTADSVAPSSRQNEGRWIWSSTTSSVTSAGITHTQAGLATSPRPGKAAGHRQPGAGAAPPRLAAASGLPEGNEQTPMTSPWSGRVVREPGGQVNAPG